MKTTKVVAIHRTYEQSKAFNRDIVLYRSDDKPLRGRDPIIKWIKTLKEGQVIRTTYVNCTDEMLLLIAEQGAKLQYANWHSTLIEKGLEPQEIADKFAKVDASIFRPFNPRRDIAALRTLIDMRRALVEERKKAVQRIKATARGLGMTEEGDYDEATKKMLAIASRIDASVENDGKTKKVDWLVEIEKNIAKAAAQIKECVLFNTIAHIETGTVTAASVVSLTGGIDRFEAVSSLWCYCGEHVTKDGNAPKRKVGEPSNWNARLRTVLWQMGDSIIKNRDNPWRDFFDKVRAEEIASHDTLDQFGRGIKCKQNAGKPCKHKDGHCTARAQRKMRKEIMKRFFLACQSTPFEKGHKSQPPDSIAAD